MALLFDSLFDLSPDRWPTTKRLRRAFVPPADLLVTDGEVTVVMDVPGLTAENLEIELVGDVLTVTGERTHPFQDGDRSKTWYRLERGYGRFQRILQVPKGLDPQKISASITDGVLTLHIPQPEASKPRRIEIATAAAQPTLSTGEPHPDFDGSAVESETPAEQRELVGATA